MIGLPSRLRNIADSLRSDVFRRVMAAAQKNALLWWRDREQSPGVAARFTRAGAQFYRFGRRASKPANTLPYYHISGKLRAAILRRKPHTKYRGEVVETSLSIDGAALNFLSRVNPVRGINQQVRTVTETYVVDSHTRSSPSGGTVTVRGFAVTRTVTRRRTTLRREPPSMREEFAPRTVDVRAIQARLVYEWGLAVKRIALTKDGRIRAAALREGAGDGG